MAMPVPEEATAATISDGAPEPSEEEVILHMMETIAGATDSPNKRSLMKKYNEQLKAIRLRQPVENLMATVNAGLEQKRRQERDHQQQLAEQERLQAEQRVQLDHKVQQSAAKRFLWVLATSVAIVLVVLALGWFITLLPESAREFVRVTLLRQKPLDTSPVIVYSLLSKLNSDGCVLVYPEDIQQGRFFGKYRYDDVRTSMLWHMVGHNYSGICAQHVGLPMCYCMLDMKRFDADGQEYEVNQTERNIQHYERGVDYLELFNVDIVGATTDDQFKVNEANAFCPRPEWRTRYLQSVATFLVPRKDKPRKMTQLFNSTHSYNLQHFYELSHGLAGCTDDASHLLRERLLDPNSRSVKTGRMLLLGHPGGTRTSVAAPLPPAPMPELPRMPSHQDIPVK
jgi:hypothetical protein